MKHKKQRSNIVDTSSYSPMLIVFVCILFITALTVLYTNNNNLMRSPSAQITDTNTPPKTNIGKTNNANTDTTSLNTNTKTLTVPSIAPQKTIDFNNESLVKLTTVSPSSAIQGQTIILKGEKFGSRFGQVWFYTPEGVNAGGPSIQKWSDTEIETRVGFMLRGTNRKFYLEVQTSDGTKSNKIPFTVTAGQPIIDNVSSSTLVKNSQVTLSGSEFGTTQGTLTFYNQGGNAWNESIAATATVVSWSDTNATFIVPGNLENKEYGFDLKTNDGRNTSAKFFKVSN